MDKKKGVSLRKQHTFNSVYGCQIYANVISEKCQIIGHASLVPYQFDRDKHVKHSSS